jgi:hypothetical protein
VSAQEPKLDIELLQVRWLLNGINPEELPAKALAALEHGYEGTALRRLAGLVRPTRADLGNLPEQTFADMDLKPIDEDQAVALLIARGEPFITPVVAALVEAFPDAAPRWRKHIASWGGAPAGSYVEMAELVHFVVEDLYEKQKLDEVQRMFEMLEQLLAHADQETTDLITLGFFETLQNFASWRPYGNKVFKPFLGPKSAQIWREIERIWAGKSSLAEVIRAEREG